MKERNCPPPRPKDSCKHRQCNNKCGCACQIQCQCPIKSKIYIVSYYQDRSDDDTRSGVKRGEYMSFSNVIKQASKKMISPVVSVNDPANPSTFGLCPGTYRITYTLTWTYNPRKDLDPRLAPSDPPVPSDNEVKDEVYIADGERPADGEEDKGEFFNTRNIMSMYIPYEYKPPNTTYNSTFGTQPIRVNVGGTYLITIEKFMSIGIRRSNANNDIEHIYRDRTLIIELIACADGCE